MRGDRQDRRERHRRCRAQRLARGDRGHARLAVRGRAQPDVPAAGAPGVQELLGLLGRDVVGQGAPEPLRGDVVGLLHDALAVAAPRRARPHGHAVVLGHRGERRGDPPGSGVHDGGHPVEPPRRGQPAQGAGDLVQALDQVRLVHRGRQPAAPPPRVRQRPDQQARLGAPAPVPRAGRAAPPSPTGSHRPAGARSPPPPGPSPDDTARNAAAGPAPAAAG